MTDLDPRITDTLSAAGVTAPTDHDIAWAIGKIEMEQGIKLPMPEAPRRPMQPAAATVLPGNRR